MALTKKDLQQIQNLLTAQDQRLRLDLREALTQQAQDIKRDIRDEMDARFSAFRNEIHQDMRTLKGEIKQEIRSEFLDVLQQNILPVIDKAFEEIRGVRRFVGMAP